MTVPRKRGQPLKLLDQDRVDNLLRNIRLGAYMDAAAEHAGIGERTLYRWLEKGRTEAEHVDQGHEPNPDEAVYLHFWQEVQKARAEAEVRHVANITTAANNGTWQASAWWLERTRPEKYGRKLVTEVSGPDKGPIQVEITPEALERRIAAILGEIEGEVVDAEIVGEVEA